MTTNNKVLKRTMKDGSMKVVKLPKGHDGRHDDMDGFTEISNIPVKKRHVSFLMGGGYRNLFELQKSIYKMAQYPHNYNTGQPLLKLADEHYKYDTAFAAADNPEFWAVLTEAWYRGTKAEVEAEAARLYEILHWRFLNGIPRTNFTKDA